MNRSYKIKVNIIAIITMIIMLSGCFLFNSNAVEDNTVPPTTGDNTNTSDPEPTPEP